MVLLARSLTPDMTFFHWVISDYLAMILSNVRRTRRKDQMAVEEESLQRCLGSSCMAYFDVGVLKSISTIKAIVQSQNILEYVEQLLTIRLLFADCRSRRRSLNFTLYLSFFIP